MRSKTYVSVFNLKYHIEANLNDEKHRQQIYQCALCGSYELFSLASDLRIHFLKSNGTRNLVLAMENILIELI